MAVGSDGSRHQLPILYGSQTGNAQDVAERIAREGARRHYLTYAISMDTFDPMVLPKEQMILFVTSTTGQGDPPDNMKKFWKSLLRKSLPGDWLAGVHFAIFGLGDSGYQKYNAVAKKLERRLLGLGASPIIPKGLGDDQHRSGYEAALDPWLAALWPALRQRAPLGPGLVDTVPGMENMRVLDPPKFKVTYCRASPAVQWEQRPDWTIAAASRNGGGEETAYAEAVRRWEKCEAARCMVEEAEKKYMEMRAGKSVNSASYTQKVKVGCNLKRPDQSLVRMVKNERITATYHFQDVRHIEVDFGNSGLTYAPGDLLNVLPSQPTGVIDEFLERCGLDPEALVWVEASSAMSANENGLGHELPQQMDVSGINGTCEARRKPPIELQNSQAYPHDILNRPAAESACSNVQCAESSADPGFSNRMKGGSDSDSTGNRNVHGVAPVSIGAIVAYVMDIASSSPPRYFFEVLSQFAKEEREAERLQYFASAEGRDDLYEYNNRERRTVLEVLQDFPSAHMPLEWLLQTVPRLQPRAFSISSSMRYHPNQAHITVAIVNWKTPYNRIRKGLCSNWLATLDTHEDEVYIPVRISEGALRMPAPSVPLILVGPGTGCAPFRAFIEDRRVLLAAEVNQPSAPSTGHLSSSVAPVFFFFGCRNENGDFLYHEEWESHQSTRGVLCSERGGGFAVAFSRDQPSKVYVQHKIRADRDRLWHLLQKGAHIYVAGSASKMPAAVSAAFKDVAIDAGGLTKVQAAKWMEEMERGGRYHVEAWS